MAEWRGERIDRTLGAGSVYVQVARILRRRIALGGYRDASDASVQLPSIGKIAEEFGVGRDVARKAVDLLKIEGLVVTQQGRPAYVRVEPPLESLPVYPGDRLRNSPPTDEERKAQQIPPGVKMYRITRADGTAESFRDDRYEFLVEPRSS